MLRDPKIARISIRNQAARIAGEDRLQASSSSRPLMEARERYGMKYRHGIPMRTEEPTRRLKSASNSQSLESERGRGE